MCEHCDNAKELENCPNAGDRSVRKDTKISDLSTKNEILHFALDAQKRLFDARIKTLNRTIDEYNNKTKQLQREIDKLNDELRSYKEEPCKACDGQGYHIEEYPEYQYVTHDMASDACDMSLEGQEIEWGSTQVQVSCDNCNGSGTVKKEKENDSERI